jgi:phage tail sheath protein FI
MPTYDYPGVYIEEQPAASPIQGVGTSTAAFIGVARGGPVNQPAFVTSFDEFRQTFDAQPMDGFYLWYAVRAFFDNGGRRAYIVKASSGRTASLALPDSRAVGAQTALVVVAQALGVPSPDITVTVTHTSLVPSVNVLRWQAPVAQANGDRIRVAAVVGPPALTAAEAAARFRVGDSVHITENANQEDATVREVRGDLLLLEKPLAKTYAGGNVRLADLKPGGVSLRLEAAAAGLAPGSVITIAQGATGPETLVVKQVQAERITPDLTTYRVDLQAGLANTYDRASATAIVVKSQEFTLAVTQDAVTETRAHLSMDRRHPRYVGAYLAQQPFSLVTVSEPAVPSNADMKDRSPAETANQKLVGGKADAPQDLTPADFQDALDALRTIDEVNFIAIPDAAGRLDVQMALLAHCENLRDRFAIFDAPQGLPPTGPGSIRDWVAALRSDRGYGALYYPWVLVSHPAGGTVAAPPSGHVAGVYARSDGERGVNKAPANFTLNSALGVVTLINDDTQGPLNIDGVNVLRVFPGQARPVVWGARTTSPQTAWQYVNIRRLLLFIEESIEEGIRWAVFEPHNPALWAKLRRTIIDFLTRIWRDGALFGAKPDDAFYVRIDESNNPPGERALGRLYIEIGLRPVYPAEFIVVRIGFWEGGSEVSE